MLAKYFAIIRNYVLSVSTQRKYDFYYKDTLLDAFRTNSRNVIDRNPSMVIPLPANQDLTPMLLPPKHKKSRDIPVCVVSIAKYKAKQRSITISAEKRLKNTLS